MNLPALYGERVTEFLTPPFAEGMWFAEIEIKKVKRKLCARTG